MDEFFARNRLSAYIDGELPDNEMAEVANSIEENEELRREYKEVLAAVEFVRRHGPVSAPARFHRNVMQAVDDLPLPDARFSWIRRAFSRFSWEGLAVAAVAVTVLVLAWVAPQNHRQQTVQPAPAPVEAPAVVDAGTDVPEGEPVAEAPGVGVLPPDVASSDLEARGAGEPTAPVVRLVDPERRTGASTRRTASIPTPTGDDVYVPDWDRNPEGTARVETVQPAPAVAGLGPVSYILYPNYPDALKGLSDVAYRLGGTALDGSGEALVPSDLTIEKNHARVILQVPPAQIGSLETQLKTLGGVICVQAPGPAAPGIGAISVHVEVLYEP